MYKQEICLATSDEFGVPEREQIRLFKIVGFDGFFCEYESGKDLVSLKEYADSIGIKFQSVHAPFSNMASMWFENEKTAAAQEELLSCVKEAFRAKVPIVVMHAFCGVNNHNVTTYGIERFRTVVDFAEKLNVKIAFENTEGEEYLAALMEAFKNKKHVGFCIDTGHEMCYNHSKDMLSLYGDRLFCTHLNDNFGISDYNGDITWLDDLHLLPFDGIADWKGIVKRLNSCGYNGELTFELNKKSKPGRHENDGYSQMNLLLFLTEAYKRAKKVAALKTRNGVTEQ